MSSELTVTLVSVFLSTALLVGLFASTVLGRTAPELKRLRDVTRSSVETEGARQWLPDVIRRTRQAALSLRKSSGKNTRLTRRLEEVGWDDPVSLWIYSTSQIVLPIVTASAVLVVLGIPKGLLLALIMGFVGYMIPDLVVSRRIAQRRRAIRNGLPDALDLIVVCVEAGSSLDQAILRASEELVIALPAIAHELRIVATEIRAGKARLQAFQGLAKRTGLDEVRAFVTVLIQTDRFGTSIAQALRTHADTLRTKRRQQAEERAGKVGVKLVFPLVLCLLPSLYAVCLGPAVVRMIRAFGG